MSLSRHLQDRRGIAALEFAIIAPVLILLLLATTDLMIWMRTWLCMEQTASQLAQIITQYSTLYTSDFTGTFYPLAQTSVSTTTLSCNGGGVIVTGIDNSTGTPAVGWQWSSGSCVSSGFTAAKGGSASVALPGGYVPPAGYSAIVVELFTTQPEFVFSQGIMATAGLSSIHTYAIAVPRGGALPALATGGRPS